MKILIVCQTMTYYSGSPLYNYTIALELKRLGHNVSVLSKWSDNKIKSDLKEAGINCLESTNEEYDLALVSQRDFPIPKAVNIINIVHSEYDCETPIIEGIKHWVAIRPSIKEHIVNEHGIDPKKVSIIYNGVDLERFKPISKTKRDYIKVVIPATIDNLRQKMFNYHCEKANKDYQVFIYGSNFGASIPSSPYIHIHNEVHNIEDYIGDADLVAGILLGRVNLEARACDVPSIIHNPENPEEIEQYYPDRKDFENKHDIKKVVKQILCLVQTTDKSQ
jgi:glycosyltransferase involved in cell wall biosynthesis